MINNHITKEELEILIADHVKNAIIAVKCSNNSNRSILVRIGKIDGQYSIYIYDSGIEFEINTLHKLGKIPSTTHKESGGTGMGFMNTFDTLRKYNASLSIEEFNEPIIDNYTKVIAIKFDKKKISEAGYVDTIICVIAEPGNMENIIFMTGIHAIEKETTVAKIE